MKAAYVDIQDQRRLLKAGDNMTGNLQMSGNLVHGLPIDYPPLYSGDEAVSWSQAVGLVQDAAYIKPIITVWTEVRRQLDKNKYEWSFGDGGGRYNRNDSGYTMLAPGRVLRMGLSVFIFKDIKVSLVHNGEVRSQYSVTKPDDKPSGTIIFNTPLELEMGDILNFRTETDAKQAFSAVVSLLIELDL